MVNPCTEAMKLAIDCPHNALSTMAAMTPAPCVSVVLYHSLSGFRCLRLGVGRCFLLWGHGRIYPMIKQCAVRLNHPIEQVLWGQLPPLPPWFLRLCLVYVYSYSLSLLATLHCCSLYVARQWYPQGRTVFHLA